MFQKIFFFAIFLCFTHLSFAQQAEILQAFETYQQKNYEQTIVLLEKNLPAIENLLIGKKDSLYIEVLEMLKQSHFQVSNKAKSLEYTTKIQEFSEKMLARQEISKKLAVWDSLNLVFNKNLNTKSFEKAIDIAEQMCSEAEKVLGKEHLIYAKSLENLANAYEKNRDLEKAEDFWKKSNESYKKASTESSPEYAKSCFDLAIFSEKIDKKDQAEENYVRAASIFKLVLGETNDDFLMVSNNLFAFYYNNSKLTLAESQAQKNLEISKKKFSQNDQAYTNAILNLAKVSKSLGKYDLADQYYKQNLDIQRINIQNKPLEFAQAAHILASFYYERKQYPQAENLFKESLQIRKETKSEKDYAQSLFSLATLYRAQGKYPLAEPLFAECLAIRKEIGESTPSYATTLNGLGMLYQEMRQYEKAEKYYDQALNIRGIVLNPQQKHPDYVQTLSNLASLHQATGNFQKSEPLFKKCLQILESSKGKENALYTAILGNLGNLYVEMGLYEKAEQAFKQSILIEKEILGENHPDYAISLNNLADLLETQKKYAESEKYYWQSIDITKKVYGEKSINYALLINNLANLFLQTDKYLLADSLMRQTVSIKKELLGDQNANYATSLTGLARTQQVLGNLQEAETSYLEAIKIYKNTIGEQQPDYIRAVNNLAAIYNQQERYTEAEPLYLQAIQNKLQQILKVFPSLSEQEKARFWQSNHFYFENFYAFAVKRYETNPKIAGMMYDLQLSTKAMLLSASAKMKSQIMKSNDSQLIEMFKEWQTAREFLAKTYTMTPEELAEKNITGIKELEESANNLEKELSEKSSIFANYTDEKLPTWQDIQAKLKNDQMAIEMIRMRTYQDGNDTLYVALTLNSTDQNPKMIILPKSNLLETKHLAYYRNAAKNRKTDKHSHSHFWKPIWDSVANKNEIKKIYFSPDGSYNQLSMNTLFNPKTSEYLIDEVELHQLTNTRDLLSFEQNKEKHNFTAVLFGRPQYNLEKPLPEIKTKNLPDSLTILKDSLAILPDSSKISREKNSNENAKYADLLGTETEVDSIENILQRKNWQVQKLMHADALEEQIKRLDNPRVLHIATHGFWATPSENRKKINLAILDHSEKTTEIADNPMLRSGIVMAGAESLAKNNSNFESENGILTAYEAMNLNLDNTDLVVLSACETGLGDIQNGEGVYGLQRALRVAGAKTLVMSLWTVSDAATQELMRNFYAIWAENNDARMAFKEAQKKLRQKYPQPYFWGAFIMIGQ